MNGLDVLSALAVRLHESAGTPRGDSEAARRLSACAAPLASRIPLAAPPERTRDGSLLLMPTRAEDLLELIEEMADGLRPDRTTFGLAIRPAAGHSTTIDAAAMGADAVATAALTALLATGVRSARVAALAPGRRPMLESLITLVLEFIDRMTERQRQIIALVRESDTQQQVAQHLGVSRQAVNQSLTSAGWSHILRAEEAIRDALSELTRDAVFPDETKGEHP
jgi:hypothetical protein